MEKEYDFLSDIEMRERKSNIQNYTMRHKSTKKDKIYNPNSTDRICCIELKNNNKIYIQYGDKWTIKDVYIFL